MHGMRTHVGGRTVWWMEGCENEWVYGWMARMDEWGWIGGGTDVWVNEWVGEYNV